MSRCDHNFAIVLAMFCIQRMVMRGFRGIGFLDYKSNAQFLSSRWILSQYFTMGFSEINLILKE